MVEGAGSRVGSASSRGIGGMMRKGAIIKLRRANKVHRYGEHGRLHWRG